MTALLVYGDIDVKLQRSQWRPDSHPDDLSISLPYQQNWHGRLCIDKGVFLSLFERSSTVQFVYS